MRYYPRRVVRRGTRASYSPAQALHLMNDPSRAALAQRTGEGHELVVDVPVVAQATPPPAGRFRRWLDRLLGR